MNRLYGVIVADLLCFAIFIGLALSGRQDVNGAKTTRPGTTDKPAGIPGALKPRVSGNELRLALDTEPPTLDPISIADTFSDGVANKIFNKLVRLQLKDDGKLEITNDLAESFTLTDENRVYTFKLRKGVHFHNGREVKAQDVVYSLKRLMSPQSKRADLMFPFVKGSEAYYNYKSTKANEVTHEDPNLGIKALDDYTVQITLDAPFAPFIQHLSTISCAVIPQEVAEDSTTIFSRQPVGTGPFKLAVWAPGQHLLLKRNDDYFNGKPKLEWVKFYIIKNRILHLERFLAGELDASIFPNGEVKSTVAKVGLDNVMQTPAMRTNYVGIGMPNGDFKDKADLKPWGTNKLLRQAMNYAIDRDYLVDNIYENRAIPATGILPPGMPGYKEGRPGWPRDLEKARALLKQAGFPDGKGLPPVTMIYRQDEDTKNIAQALQHDFEEIGIRVELEPLEWSRFLETVEQKPQSLFILGWVADYPDPDNFLYVLFNTKQWGSAGNHTWYANKEVDELTQKARTLSSMDERAKIYNRVEDIILDESPWLCTVHMVNRVLLRKEIKGLRGHVTPLDTGTEFPQVDFTNVSIEQ